MQEFNNNTVQFTEEKFLKSHEPNCSQLRTHSSLRKFRENLKYKAKLCTTMHCIFHHENCILIRLNTYAVYYEAEG